MVTKRRSIRFLLRITPVEVFDWFPAREEGLAFAFEREGVTGSTTLTLDPEAVEWEPLGEENAPAMGYCARLLIEVEGECSETTTTAAFLAMAHELAVRHTNDFVSYVRNELGQYNVDPGPIVHWGISEFLSQSNAKWVDNGEREVGIPLGGWPSGSEILTPRAGLHGRKRSLSKLEWEEMRQTILRGYSPSPTRELLANALRFLDIGQYGLAAVVATTALETRLEDFVKRRCGERGISANTFQDMTKDLYVSAHLRLLFPLVLGRDELDKGIAKIMREDLGLPYQFTGEQILAWCRDLIRSRNRFVHQAERPQFDVVERGIDAVDLLLRFIQVATAAS